MHTSGSLKFFRMGAHETVNDFVLCQNDKQSRGFDIPSSEPRLWSKFSDLCCCGLTWTAKFGESSMGTPRTVLLSLPCLS